MQTHTTEKELQYRTLVTEVREAYLSGSRELQWHEDCKEINLWTYWQGRGHLDADIMLVGQDWGCPWDEAYAETIQNVRNLNRNILANYLQGNHSTTDKNLISLFQTIGFEIQADDPRLFFTNLVMGYRSNGTSGGFKQAWATADAPFFRRLVEIIQPRILLCLGKETFRHTLRAFNVRIPSAARHYNAFLEGNEQPVRICYGNNATAFVFGLAHCGVMGTLNRNRATQEKCSLNLQKRDWEKIRPFIWSTPELLRSYWKPYLQLLQEIENSKEKTAWCKHYSVYAPYNDTYHLEHQISKYMQESYHNSLVITNYWEIIDRLHLSETAILTADEKWLRSLPIEGIAACLAYHFRQDHFCEGSLVHTSIANGCMLRIMTQLYALLPWK